MACGRPVITSNVSSAKDAITSHEYGYVVEARTADDFATVIIEAMKREFDERAIRTYAEFHSWVIWAERANNIFLKTLCSNRFV